LETAAKVNISDVVDNSKLGPFQIRLFALCSLCLIMDGFDVQAMGYVAPAIVQDWNISKAQLGPVFGAGLFGVLLGALLFSMVADKIGRRPVLIWATVFFSVMTLVTARASSLSELLTLRFITGMGLGGIVPNAMALVGEYSPRRIRITLMIIAGAGFTTGAALGGLLSSWLIPEFGWRAVFYFGGAAPLVLSLIMFFSLPESLHFLALRGKDPDKIGSWLKQIDSNAPADGAQYTIHEEKKEGVPVVHLFHDGRATATILLWAINFLNLLNLYFLSNWLPTIIKDAGYTTSKAVLAGTTLQVGGIIGTFALGWFIDRLGFIPSLTACFAVACISVGLIGQPTLSLTLLFAVVFVAGFCVVGSQPAVFALAATYYPTYLRSTGIGWSSGIGRVGAIVGPVLAGELIRLHWSAHDLFTAAAVPAAISAVVVFCLRPVMKAHSATSQAVK
jgi:AAHS family 4-hydroxybenzoate transporter-like MFS transporter